MAINTNLKLVIMNFKENCKRLLLFSLFLLFVSGVSAQIQVTGVVIDLITKTNSPIYVVNEERELKGLVPLSSIVVEMTGKDKEEINELIQNAIEL